MRKKRIQIIPASALIKCPHCSKRTRVSLSQEFYQGKLVCKKCGELIQTPPAYCCVVCAFSNKKCPQSLITEARIKGLELRYPKKEEIPKTILLVDEKILDNSNQN
jgi:predicted Zn finger-like uncharacterized protein